MARDAAARRARRPTGPVQRPWRQPVNAYEPVRVLSDDQCAAIHDASLRILEELGVEFLLPEAVDMLRFLFVDGDAFQVDETDRAKQLDEKGLDVVRAATGALAAIPENAEWSTPTIEGALRAALIDEMGLKPRLAFGPVRVAVTGSRISPPLFESIELLGRTRTLERLDAVL